MLAKILTNIALSKTISSRPENDYYDLSIRSENVIIQPKFNVYLGIISVIIGLVGGIAAMTANITAGIILLAIFAGIGIILLIQYSNYKIEYDEEKIVFTSSFGKTKEYHIKDIIQVQGVNNAVIVTTDSDKFAVDAQCIGINRFIYFMNQEFENRNS